MNETEAGRQSRPVECMVGPADVWPVPDSARQRKLMPGPWMNGDLKPTRDGKYLREFDDVQDCAFSWWRNGRWHTQDFFDVESDVQDASWRGGVLKPNAQAHRQARQQENSDE